MLARLQSGGEALQGCFKVREGSKRTSSVNRGSIIADAFGAHAGILFEPDLKRIRRLVRDFGEPYRRKLTKVAHATLPRGEQGVCKRKGESAAGAQAEGAELREPPIVLEVRRGRSPKKKINSNL
jgi:hypothetical protein